MNARNALITELNPRRAVVDAKDKLLTKQRLTAAGLPVPPTLAALDSPRQVRRFDVESLPAGVVVKPSRGSQGRGVLVVRDRITQRAFQRHALDVVDGDFSDRDGDDVVLVEPLLMATPDLAGLAPIGLPDVRVVCRRTRPLMAMLRLPTVASGGVGNLHRGGVGAAVDLATGRVTRAVADGEEISTHPDTGCPLVGSVVPDWLDVVAHARRCSSATGLGYVGVDVVIDATLGPVVLEVNSHPGLEIQNVNRRSLLAEW